MNTFSICSRLVINPSKPILLPRSAEYNPRPICVGGIGGSGTRVVAGILEGMDIFIGNNINKSKDNFDIPLNQMLNGVDDPNREPEIICKVIEDFEAKMQKESYSNNWGWKVPGSFFWLDYTSCYFPELRYIHVLRHGLDMAYSSNKNQIRNWGGLFDFYVTESPTPKQLLEFWIAVNKFAIKKASSLLQERLLIIRFDDLCANPEEEVEKIAGFLRLTYTDKEISNLASVVKSPSSLKRYKNHDIKNDFSEDLINSVIQLGFLVEVD